MLLALVAGGKANQDVRPVTAVQSVVAGLTKEPVVAAAAIEIVVAGPALESIISLLAVKVVVSRIAHQHVISRTTPEAVVATASAHGVVTVPRQEILHPAGIKIHGAGYRCEIVDVKAVVAVCAYEIGIAVSAPVELDLIGLPEKDA